MSKRFLTPPNLPSGSPLPLEGSLGDLFYETAEAKIFVHDGIEWVVAQGAGGVTVSETPPEDPKEGDGWFDPATGKQYIWYDNFWVEVTSGSGGRSSVVASETAPNDPTNGSMWFNTAEAVLLVYYDNFWIQVQGSGGSGDVATFFYGLKFDAVVGNLYIDELSVDNTTPATDVSQYFEWFTSESTGFNFEIVNDRLIMEVN